LSTRYIRCRVTMLLKQNGTQMLITFYGVRGSPPSPGPTMVKYGGNTSCVLIELSKQRPDGRTPIEVK